jgi:hypothetical protein
MCLRRLGDLLRPDCALALAHLMECRRQKSQSLSLILDLRIDKAWQLVETTDAMADPNLSPSSRRPGQRWAAADRGLHATRFRPRSLKR